MLELKCFFYNDDSICFIFGKYKLKLEECLFMWYWRNLYNMCLVSRVEKIIFKNY